MGLKVILSIFYCTTFLLAQSNSSEANQYQPRKERLSQIERAFKPSFYDTEIYLYKKNDTSRLQGRPIIQSSVAPPETLQGFRIQLLATNNFDEANTTRNSLSAQYPELWLYLVFEAPTYKIRVGDFVNRAETKTLLEQFQQQGFRSAWVVPDKIIKNQLPKPPLPQQIDSTAIGK